MRVSDVERQRVVDELRRHCAAGRIDLDEYARRVEQAASATTLGELDAVLGDLPYLRIADPSTPRTGGLLPQPEVAARVSGFWATLAVLLGAAVLLGGLLIGVAISWSWAGLLLAGWLVGLAQSALRARRRPSR